MFKIRKTVNTANALLLASSIALSAPLWAENNNITAKAAQTNYSKQQFYNKFQQSLVDRQQKRIANENNGGNKIDEDVELQEENIIIEETNYDVEYIEDDDFSYTIEENYYNDYIDLDVPTGKPFKSYMDARHITNKSSIQYQLKSQYELDDSGIYMINGRYACAIGSYYSTDVGIEFDIIMKTGDVIPCILADCKADEHTDSLGQYTVDNGSIVEFVVHEPTLIPNISNQWGNTGDISTLGGIFDGEISYIRIYQ